MNTDCIISLMKSDLIVVKYFFFFPPRPLLKIILLLNGVLSRAVKEQ